MPLANFRLSENQTASEFVVMLADDGRTRAITRIARETIDDYVEGNLSQGERIAMVERNLGALSELITAKYNAHEFTTYTDRLGITDDNNKLIVITSEEFRRCKLR